MKHNINKPNTTYQGKRTTSSKPIGAVDPRRDRHGPRGGVVRAAEGYKKKAAQIMKRNYFCSKKGVSFFFQQKMFFMFECSISF